jgi:hypothetical protein
LVAVWLFELVLGRAGAAKLPDHSSGGCCAYHAWSAAALQEGKSRSLLHSCRDGAWKDVLWLGCRGLKWTQQAVLLSLPMMLLLPARLLMLMLLLLPGEVMSRASR